MLFVCEIKSRQPPEVRHLDWTPNSGVLSNWELWLCHTVSGIINTMVAIRLTMERADVNTARP